MCLQDCYRQLTGLRQHLDAKLMNSLESAVQKAENWLRHWGLGKMNLLPRNSLKDYEMLAIALSSGVSAGLV